MHDLCGHSRSVRHLRVESIHAASKAQNESTSGGVHNTVANRVENVAEFQPNNGSAVHSEQLIARFDLARCLCGFRERRWFRRAVLDPHQVAMEPIHDAGAVCACHQRKAARD